MKEKILAAIKAKFPTINLSKKRLEAIAAKIEAKVIDDETKIDAALDVYNEYNPLADMAKQDDTLRNLNAQVKATAPGKKEETEKGETPVVDDDTPAWAKALIEQNKTLSSGLAKLQEDKTLTGIRATATEKLKDIPGSYWGKRALPDKEEDLDAFVTEVQADYTAFTKEMTDKGIAVMSAPRSASGAPAGTTKGVNPVVKQFMEKGKAVAPVNGAAATGSAQPGFINTPGPL